MDWFREFYLVFKNTSRLSLIVSSGTVLYKKTFTVDFNVVINLQVIKLTTLLKLYYKTVDSL